MPNSFGADFKPIDTEAGGGGEDGENIKFIDEGAVMDGQGSRPPRNCCLRLICVICCCDTTDIGSQTHLNALNDMEIELYQQNLKKQLEDSKKGIVKPTAGNPEEEEGFSPGDGEGDKVGSGAKSSRSTGSKETHMV